MEVSCVQLLDVGDVWLAWTRRIKKSLLFGMFKMIPLLFGGLHRRKGIFGFLRGKLCPLKDPFFLLFIILKRVMKEHISEIPGGYRYAKRNIKKTPYC